MVIVIVIVWRTHLQHAGVHVRPHTARLQRIPDLCLGCGWQPGLGDRAGHWRDSRWVRIAAWASERKHAGGRVLDTGCPTVSQRVQVLRRDGWAW